MPLSPLKLAALQRPRFALGSRNEFFSSLLGDEQAQGTIVLESKSSGLLLGMEFLRKLNKALIVGSSGVALVDDQPPAPPEAGTS